MITHAGFNSVNEAIVFGVPMVAIPPVLDHVMNARRMAALEAFVAAAKEPTP